MAQTEGQSVNLADIYNVYEPVIGLEIHTQLLTESKLFCGCPTKFGATPNANTCPICTGQPGVLPVLNEKAVELAIRVGLALHCEIQERSQFARKNYFYPDLPKAYQISMYELPIATEGYLVIDTEKGEKKIRIHRAHMEEDAGKLVHVGSERLGGSIGSLVDFNRGGTPLLEIVSHPDLSSPEEAKTYVQELRTILVHLGVSDGNMEEGSLRCDANVSLRKRGVKELGTRAEIKNMNSFRSIERAITAEIIRQSETLDAGGRIVQETRHFDDVTGTTISMRSKEEAHDYRYFPDPDLVPLVVNPDWRNRIKETVGELPRDRRRRYIELLGLPAADAATLCSDPKISEFFEAAVKHYPNAKVISNWLLGNVSGYLNANNQKIEETQLSPKNLTDLLALIDKGSITGKIGKAILPKVIESGKSPVQLIQAEGLTPMESDDELRKMIQKVITDNPKSVADYLAGKETAITFLMGQTMKATKGRANPATTRKILTEELMKH